MYTKKKLIIFVDWFLPGYKAGGQIQSCANLAEALQNRFDIYIITTDRDLGDGTAYAGIRADEWNLYNKSIQVLYVSPANLRYSFLKQVVHRIQPDSIYLNSMFSWFFTVLPLVLYYKKQTVKIVLAPRGMLHAGALSQRRRKQIVFLKIFKLAGLHAHLLFHATNKTEETDIRHIIGSNVQIRQVQDFNASAQQPFQTVKKEPGTLKCLFVARIVRHKNLLFFLSLLQQTTAQISFEIAGPVEEQDYWNECVQTINQLPANVTVSHTGAVPHEQLEKTYLAHHLLVLPTLGENFGHVIFESLLHGRPVLISDKTPWQNLQQRGAGWALPLDGQDGFLSVVQSVSGWDQQTFDAHAKAAWQYANDYILKADLTNKYVDLLSA